MPDPTHLPIDVRREVYCVSRKATASIAIKRAINNNEIVAAILFALGLSFHDRRWRSFLHSQPELDQAADGFGAAGLIILSGGPSVDRSPHLL
jgi:hypothetical protein